MALHREYGNLNIILIPTLQVIVGCKYRPSHESASRARVDILRDSEGMAREQLTLSSVYKSGQNICMIGQQQTHGY